MPSVNTLSKKLLPVRVRVEYSVNPSSNKLERVCYLESRVGELLTENIPFDWAHYMCKAINRESFYMNTARLKVPDPIAILRIDGNPLQKFDDSKIVVEDRNGVLKLADAPEYVDSIKLASALGENIFIYRWTQLPITDKVWVSAVYNVDRDKEFNLALCNAWVLDVLSSLGIIKSSGSKCVVSLDGSKVNRVHSDPHTIIIIRKVEESSDGKM